METSALESLVETIRQHHPTLEIETADAGPPHRLCVLGLE